MEPKFLDNEPACGAPRGWRWGYLTCGCRNDGYGNHLNDARSRLSEADEFIREIRAAQNQRASGKRRGGPATKRPWDNT